MVGDMAAGHEAIPAKTENRFVTPPAATPRGLLKKRLAVGL
jgi:hypothetical protein